MFCTFLFILFPIILASSPEDNLIPTQYQIDVVHLTTDLPTRSGMVKNVVTIQLKAVQHTPTNITLDLNGECAVTNVTVNVANRLLKADFFTQFESVAIRIPNSAQKHIKLGDAFRVVIKHSCPVKYSTLGKGLYFEENEDSHERVIVTQFEAINARRMFPCFDIPRFKTPFVVRVAKKLLRQGESAYSNGRQKIGKKSDKFLEFEKTIPLPTYLVALAIGKFQRANRTTQSGIDIGVIHSPTYYNYTDESIANALNTMEISLNYMTTFTGTKYQNSKLDMVAVPLKGGMENYGLITMNKDYLTKKSVIAHGTTLVTWFCCSSEVFQPCLGSLHATL